MWCDAMFFILALLLVSGRAQESDVCSDSNLDRCGRDIYLIGDPQRQPPVSPQLADQFCSEFERGFVCIKTYIRTCLSSFKAHLANVALNEIANLTRTWCSTQRDELMEHAACIAKAQPQVDRCLNEGSDSSYHVYKTMDDDSRIPWLCCLKTPFEQCIRAATQDICPENSVEFLEGLYYRYTKDLINASCFSGDNFDMECGSLPPLGKVPPSGYLSTFPGVFGVIKLL